MDKIPNFNLEPTLVAEGIAYYSRNDAAIFVGLSPHGLIKRAKNFNKQHPDTPVLTPNFGGRAVYYTQEDLRRLSALTVVAK